MGPLCLPVEQGVVMRTRNGFTVMEVVVAVVNLLGGPHRPDPAPWKL